MRNTPLKAFVNNDDKAKLNTYKKNLESDLKKLQASKKEHAKYYDERKSKSRYKKPIDVPKNLKFNY